MTESNGSMYRVDRESIFLTLLGRSPATRLIDLFLDNSLFEFTRIEIIQAVGMAKSTLYKTLPILEEAGIIINTRKIGKSSLYRLNSDSEIVQYLQAIIRSYSTAMARAEEGTAVSETERELVAT